MRRVVGTLIAVGLITAGCGSSASPSNAPIVFTAQLLPSNETSAIQGGETTGSGNVTISFTTTRDSGGNITAATASFNVNLTGFPTSTQIILAHIHQGASGVAGPIVVDTRTANGDVTLTNGAGTFQKLSIDVDGALATQIVNNPAGFYFNVHSNANKSGVARGQLVKQ